MQPLPLAIEAARAAGALLLRYFGTKLAIESKSVARDLVTEADRASEALIVARLRAAMPDAAILAEESGAHAGTSGRRWIVDPLDGTTNFAHGYPPFCVSIALEDSGVLEAAAIYAPYYDELFCAARGQGATLNDRALAVSAVARVEEGLLCTGFAPRYRDRNIPEFVHMMQVAQAIRRDGSAALNLAYVAAGRFDGFWEYGLAPWDIAAGALIIREAGGVVSNIDDAPLGLTDGQILATNGLLHEPMRAHLVSAR